MTRLITALIIGAIFGTGLAIAGMLNPSKVVGFLDVFGDWQFNFWHWLGTCRSVSGASGGKLASEWPSDAAGFWSYDRGSSGWPNCDAPSGLV